MIKTPITDVTAKNIAIEEIVSSLRNNIELVECPQPNGQLAYNLAGRTPTDFYFFHVKSHKITTGEARIICISKVDGEVVFDGYVGE